MMRMLLYIITSITIFSNTLFCDEVKKQSPETNTENTKKKTAEEFTTEDIKLLSQAYGHMIGQNLNSIGLNLDSAEIIHGIQGAFNGMESPLKDSKTIEMITALQEKKFKDECNVNLKAAEAFLALNKKNADIQEIEEGLQYKQLSEGSGKECKETDTPVISYIGKYLDGEIFGKSNTDEAITLSDTIEGFRKAIIGMKVGEKREVYIHPNLGYGVNSCLSPNALLTFEIELKSMKENEKINKEKSEISTFPLEDTLADSSKEIEIK